MKKGFKPAGIAFYFLTLIVFFIIGIYIAGFVGAGKNQMLAGGAIVVGWGVLFAAIAFFASFFIAYYAQHRNIVRLNWILLVLLVILYGITQYRYIERQKEKKNEEIRKEQPQKKTTKSVPVEPSSMTYEKIALKKSPIEI
ncbi:MAG: hypothetical protein AB7W47_08855 [Calditrichaceae bacterium]